MRLAVLGVGLIGGSIGLGREAAHGRRGRRLRPGSRKRGARRWSWGPSITPPRPSPRLSTGAEIVFCAAPIGALSALVREALEASGEEAVVTDVGSTKEALLAGLADQPEERFIGGHPLAGAETAGVENARADLFEGARWYLTPTERSSGLLYDRLQRAVADLGARPQAIDAETHDRLMATVSHLPHVIANVLVEQAAAAAAEESERLPEFGPELPGHDPGRGRQPGDLGRHLRHQPRGGGARGRGGLRAAARGGRADPVGRPGAGGRLARRSPRASPPPAGGRSGRRRALRAAARGREPAGDRRRARPGARQAPASTSRTWPSTRRPTCAPARSRCGSPARTRPSGRPRSCGGWATTHPSGGDAVRPLGAAARRVAPAARQVHQPPGGADRGDGGGGDGDRGLPGRGRHAGDPERRSGARRGARGARPVERSRRGR